MSTLFSREKKHYSNSLISNYYCLHVKLWKTCTEQNIQVRCLRGSWNLSTKCFRQAEKAKEYNRSSRSLQDPEGQNLSTTSKLSSYERYYFYTKDTTFRVTFKSFPWIQIKSTWKKTWYEVKKFHFFLPSGSTQIQMEVGKKSDSWQPSLCYTVIPSFKYISSGALRMLPQGLILPL